MHLTVRDAATIFGVPEDRIYRWISDDDLPSRQVNGQHFFNQTELMEWATVHGVHFNPDLFQEQSQSRSTGQGLVEALQAGNIVVGLGGLEKKAVLQAVVEKMSLPEGFDRTGLCELFLARESAGSTAIGDGIAIPHPRYPVVLPVGHPTLTLCFLNPPVDFGAPDGQPVDTLFLLVSPTIRAHLGMLARIACAIRDERLRAALKRRGSRAEILKELSRVEDSFDRSATDATEPA
jgi:nitrogen PTS system EIIA component